MNAVIRPLSTIDGLAAAGIVAPERVAELGRVAARYAVAVTPAMLATIDPAYAADPIARQFVPDIRELETRADEAADPIADEANSPVAGVVHRYPDRVLLKVASVCPVYCRFCFRRETVGPDLGHSLGADEIGAALDYIRATPAIWEVILTGGDPLILSPRRVREITQALSEIPHVKVLRWHSRVPVVSPERVTDELIDALKSTHQAAYVALHANHPRELTPEARAACARLVDRGIVMVSQSVLLAGINDDAATLDQLMRAFVESRVKPYYLHHLDRAPGTSHFRTTIAEGQVLMRQLRGRLSGLAQPTYVIDLPGGHGKMPIGPDYLQCGDGHYQITDYQGVTHDYCDCGHGHEPSR
ncbi:MAG: lysine-2,3-aminomutase-like protein [Hyphomicrobiaceae bacterium]